MTERLYYRDPYLAEFDATVIGVERLEGKTLVRLDRTAFYPTSGGQPFDRGALGAHRVVDVLDTDDGDVVHVIEGSPVTGEQVHARIDWERRFDHMQQHTGQHVLSAAFETLLSARTESFHLGDGTSTIDLNRDLGQAEITRAEEDANRVLWEDREVAIRFVDAEEAARLPLRKEPTRGGTLRLIEVAGYDLSACGGTHVARTGAIGVIAIAGWERFKGGTRVEFVCGGRALRSHRRLRDVAASAARMLTVHVDDLPATIERVQGEMKDLRRSLKDAHAQLAASRARALADAAADGVVVAALDGWDPNALKLIASQIVDRPGFVVGLLSVPPPSSLVIARSADVRLDSGATLREVASAFGGKGGGRPELAQGGGITGAPADVLKLIDSLLRGARAL